MNGHLGFIVTELQSGMEQTVFTLMRKEKELTNKLLHGWVIIRRIFAQSEIVRTITFILTNLGAGFILKYIFIVEISKTGLLV
jgi:hypothetical protein